MGFDEAFLYRKFTIFYVRKLSYILKIAKNENIDKIRLDSSITAKSFFEKFGFKQIKENPFKRKDIEFINFSMEREI